MSLSTFVKNSMRDTAPIVDAYAGSEAEFWALEIMDTFDLPRSMNVVILGRRNSNCHEVYRHFGSSEILTWIQWKDNKLVLTCQQRYWTAYNAEDPVWEMTRPSAEHIKTVYPGCAMTQVSAEDYDWVPEEIFSLDVPFVGETLAEKLDATKYDFKAGLMKLFEHFTDPETTCVIPGCGSMDTAGGKYGGYCRRCLKVHNATPCKRCGHRFGCLATSSGCHAHCAAMNNSERLAQQYKDTMTAISQVTTPQFVEDDTDDEEL